MLFQILVMIILVILTQLIMLLSTKQAMMMLTQHGIRNKFPLLLCWVEFLVASVLARALLAVQQRKQGQSRKQQHSPQQRHLLYHYITPLSISWTFGFVLFNASASVMSPAHVDLIRCTEPLATVLIGFVLSLITTTSSQSYSYTLLATLIPIVGGVLWASPREHHKRHESSSVSSLAMTPTGIVLAFGSNLCFCLRPFLLQRLKRYQEQVKASQEEEEPPNDPNGNGHNDNNHHHPPQQEPISNKSTQDLQLFWYVTAIAATAMAPIVVVVEGSDLLGAWKEGLLTTTTTTSPWRSWCLLTLLSSCFFFAYQYLQLQLMTLLAKRDPLHFSILTPLIKAVLIVLCCWWYGHDFGANQMGGVAVTTLGGYWFVTVQHRERRQEQRQGGGGFANNHNHKTLHATTTTTRQTNRRPSFVSWFTKTETRPSVLPV